ncbi:MAG TPA: hypothetical protein VFY65_21265, partial [Longimicrobium sp.]|nr:hypothetical protein [Longimicrobium sp.]
MIRRAAIFTAAAAVLSAGPAGAQDVEALSEVGGVPLPAGYWARIRQNPDFFETRREWRNVAAGAGLTFRDSVLSVTPTRGTLRMVVMMGLFSDSP